MALWVPGGGWSEARRSVRAIVTGARRAAADYPAVHSWAPVTLMAGSTKRKRRSRGGGSRGGASRSGSSRGGASACGASPAGASGGSAPKAVRSERREQGAQRQAVSERDRRAGQRMLGTVGERPPSPFGGLPVSETAILIGGIAFVIGAVQLLTHNGVQPALYVGVAVVAVGVIEVTAREHFSGYRSHTTLLAGIPSVALEVLLVAIAGSRTTRQELLVVIVPVFGGLFWILRRSFMAARQRRVAKR